MLFPDQERPIQPAGRFRRSPHGSVDLREWNFFPGEGAKPACLVGAGFEFDRDGSFLRQVNGIYLASLCQTIGAVVYQFVVRLRFPPLETGEKINHVLVSFEHDHGVIPSTVDPTSASIRPDVDAPSRAFSRSSVSARHRDFPGDPPQSLRGISVRFGRPVRIVIFVAVLFVRLRYDPPRYQLNLPLLEHQGMLASRPILNRREPEPIRSAVLMFAMHRMTGGKMFVGIPPLQDRSSFVSPLLVPEAVEIISQVPSDIREGR